ncbi:MAG: hypothetical protein N2747_00835 [Chitinophagaceae bacterium]|nr:hypothetical protein [Chitinophagaceae bacterium]
MRTFLIAAGLLAAQLLSAQNINDVKNLLILGQLQKAKQDVDKAMGNSKFNSKPEAWLLKSCIYSSLAMDEKNKNTPEGFQFAGEADAAYKKYREMDPALSLLSDPIYQNAVINLYSYYYSAGYNEYAKKNWGDGVNKLSKAVEYSDLLISRKLISAPLDTNVLILAAVTAENNNQKDVAASYYKRLADARLGGKEFETIYRFLMVYYFNKKDIPNFEKYKALGQQLYPESEYYTYDLIDFAVGLSETFDEKIKAIEEAIAKDPSNYKAHQVLGEVIFDTLHSNKENAVLPHNAQELEAKMIAAFKKSAELKPDSEIPYLFLGDHFITKAVKVNDERAAHAADMKKRTKPGHANSKEDIAKRDMLDKKYGEALEVAREPYEKAAAIMEKKELNNRDKQQLKKICNYLAEIYAYKRIMAKGNPAEQAKFAAEEKKWNDKYDNIK